MYNGYGDYMKRFFALFFAILFVFAFSGCENKKTEDKKTPITINLPKDNTVNGYRNSESKPSANLTTDSITVTENTQSYTYWGNKNSKKFHKVSCSSFKSTKDTNKVYYKSRDEFVTRGYEGCKMCNP